MIVLPSFAVTLWYALSRPKWGRLVWVGLSAGMADTVNYDVLRLTLTACGFWNDFIPLIGKLLWNDSGAHWIWGYLWRYIFNGGALGVVFVAFNFRGIRSGVFFGTFVCCCLFITLVFLTGGHVHHFIRLNPFTATYAMLGHWIYGATLGSLVKNAKNV